MSLSQRILRMLRIAAAMILAVGVLTFDAVGCSVEWRLPKDHFDGVNEYGYVSYWEKLGELDLGDGVKMPLNIGFESTRESVSPYLGHGWVLTLLDSRIVQSSEREFQMVQPDGYTVSFGRDGKNANLLNGSAGWKAEIRAETITAYASCGWKLLFLKGKLAGFTTPKNRTYDFVFEGGKVTEIKQRDGATLLRVEMDAASGVVTGLKYGEQHFGIELGAKPQVQSIQGRNVVAGMQSSLRQLTFPNGTKKTYEFAANESVQPTLTIGGPVSRTIVWDPATKRITKDGLWTYDITPSKVAWENAAIGRTKPTGQTEYWLYDAARGQETTLGFDGVKKIRSWFVSGKLAGANRSIVSIDAKGVRTVTNDWSYDETGRWIRIRMNNAKLSGIEVTSREAFALKGGAPIQIKGALRDGPGEISYTVHPAGGHMVPVD
jgi:hypothetical protein